MNDLTSEFGYTNQVNRESKRLNAKTIRKIDVRINEPLKWKKKYKYFTIYLFQFCKRTNVLMHQNAIVLLEKVVLEFIDYKQDSKPFYATIYSLELADSDKIINKLENLQQSF